MWRHKEVKLSYNFNKYSTFAVSSERFASSSFKWCGRWTSPGNHRSLTLYSNNWNKLRHKNVFVDIFELFFSLCFIPCAHILNIVSILSHTHNLNQSLMSHSPSISSVYRQLDLDGAVCLLLPWQPSLLVPREWTAAAHYLHHLSRHTHRYIHTFTQKASRLSPKSINILDIHCWPKTLPVPLAIVQRWHKRTHTHTHTLRFCLQSLDLLDVTVNVMLC